MIELIAAAVTGAVVGYFGASMIWQKLVKVQRGLIAEQRRYITDVEDQALMTVEALTALRDNCFIPDERGVKVRHSEASVARRLKAETPKEVV